MSPDTPPTLVCPVCRLTFTTTSHTKRHLRKGSCPRICTHDDHDAKHEHDLVRELFSTMSYGRNYILEKMWDSSHIVTQSRLKPSKAGEKGLFLVMQCKFLIPSTISHYNNISTLRDGSKVSSVTALMLNAFYNHLQLPLRSRLS